MERLLKKQYRLLWPKQAGSDKIDESVLVVAGASDNETSVGLRVEEVLHVMVQ